jgi:glycerophosphoryl diester phosphodiesterase
LVNDRDRFLTPRCVLNDQRSTRVTRIVGHRGASATHPENTVAAFVAAREAGADGIELDVRRTVDDVLVVHHDAALADGRLLRRTPAAELPDHVPTLAEALEACGELWVNVEIKNLPSDPDYDAEHGISVAVAALVTAYGAGERVLVSSFDMATLDRLRAVEPSIPTGWLVSTGSSPAALLDRAAAHGMDAVHPYDLLVDEGFLRRARDRGLAVNVWTVDDPDRIVQLARWAVDGIITNDPVAARRALDRVS